MRSLVKIIASLIFVTSGLSTPLFGQIISTTPNPAPSYVAFKPASGSMEDLYIWKYGNGRVTQGFRGANVYETPGTYTVILEHTSATTKVTKTYTSSLVVSNFSQIAGAKTFYVDCNLGNDTNAGDAPSRAWKTVMKIPAHLNSLDPSLRGNLSYKMKSGCTFQTPAVNSSTESSWMSLTRVGAPGQVRFEAYSNADGSYDLAQPRPIITDDPNCNIGSSCPKGFMIYAFNDVKNLLFYNLVFSGHYNKFDNPDSAARPDSGPNRSYPTNFWQTWCGDYANSGNFHFHRVTIEKLGGGIYAYPYRTDFNQVAVTNPKITKNQMTPVAGQWGANSAVIDSEITYSGQSHLTYLEGKDFVFQGNLMNYTSIGATGHASGIRFAGYPDTSGYWTENILIADNTVLDTAGTGIALQRNGGEMRLRNVVIERNKIDSSYDQSVRYDRSVIWPEAPSIDIGDSLNVRMVNNLIIDQRYYNANANQVTEVSNQFLNNTIIFGPASVRNGANFPLFQANSGVVMKNNILSGHVLMNSGTNEQIWGNASGPNFLSAARLNQSSMDFASTVKTDLDFLHLKDGSGAIEVGVSLPILDDFYGSLRLDTLALDMGAIDFIPEGSRFCTADYNKDGFVDGLDYSDFLNDWTVLNQQSDMNLDGFVDGIDYDIFMNAFMKGC